MIHDPSLDLRPRRPGPPRRAACSGRADTGAENRVNARRESIETVIVGGGQAGLALSYYLGQLGREHVVLERGRVAERWRSERWDSLTLLAPNWTAPMPGHAFPGDPDAFGTRDEVVRFLESYASSARAPLRCGVRVAHRAPPSSEEDASNSARRTANAVACAGATFIFHHSPSRAARHSVCEPWVSQLRSPHGASLNCGASLAQAIDCRPVPGTSKQSNLPEHPRSLPHHQIWHCLLLPCRLIT